VRECQRQLCEHTRAPGTDLFGELDKVLGIACAGALLKDGEDEEDEDEDLDEGAAGVVLVRGLDVARDDV
jgi:hypothetical protein